MSDEAVNTLREELREVAEWNVRHGIWDESDPRVLGLAIKAALDRNDAASIAGWQAWVRNELEVVRELKALGRERMRAFEASVKASRAQQKAPA